MKLPWEHDPNDLEANYKRPIPRADVIRLTVKAAVAVAAGVAWRFAILDGMHEGAKLVIALGVALAFAGVADLVYMQRYELEQIFLTSRESQILVRIGLAAGGVVLLAAGMLAYAG